MDLNAKWNANSFVENFKSGRDSISNNDNRSTKSVKL